MPGVCKNPGHDVPPVRAHPPVCEARDSSRRRALQEAFAVSARDVLCSSNAQPIKSSGSNCLRCISLHHAADNLRRLSEKAMCPNPGSAPLNHSMTSVLSKMTCSSQSRSKKPLDSVVSRSR